MTPRGPGSGVHRFAILLLAAANCAAEDCTEDGRHCRSDSADDTSLLSMHKASFHNIGLHPTISSSMRLLPVHAIGACSVGDRVKCPNSDVMCAGEQCCPGAGDGITFPCPSAPGNFTGCRSDVKVSDCLRALPGSSPSTVAGAELTTSNTYKYGKFEASIQYAGADGVVSSFFLWKPESEQKTVYWNELDFEKLGMCKMQLNLINGMPGPKGHEEHVDLSQICTAFHTYAFEWTPDYVAWSVDGVEVRRETGWNVEEFNLNAGNGLQLRLNVWPGDSNFGGTFSEDDLPVYQYIDWIRYSSYSGPGSFHWEWQEDFSSGSMPSGWYGGDWTSPLGYSAHRLQNIVFKEGNAVLALTHAWNWPTADSIPPP